MIINTIIPFLDSTDYQEFRQDRAIEKFGAGIPLCPQNHLLPFQIQRPLSWEVASDFTIELYNKNDVLAQDITSYIDASDWGIVSDNNGNDIIIHYSNTALSTALPLGVYYIKFTDTNITKYSDLFRVCEFNSDTSRVLAVDSDTSVATDGLGSLILT